jgi:uncharacterized protein (TIGR02996 family)
MDPKKEPAIEDAFLQSILENPDDDSVRLIFADWLMERDDPRGEFIRIQCELARLQEPLADWDAWAAASERLPELQAREKELLTKHGQTWSAPVSSITSNYSFRRGFIERVSLSAALFLHYRADLFRGTPIQEVHFTGLTPGDIRAIAAVPELARLKTIDLSDHYPTPAFGELLASPHLTRLAVLKLSRCLLRDSALVAVAQSPRLAQLRYLDLSRNGLTIEGVRRLFQSPWWGRRTVLNLAGNQGIAAADLESLTATLSDEARPAALENTLRLFAGTIPVSTGARSRQFAQNVARNRERAAALLTEGLNHSHRKTRVAAAQAVSGFRPLAAPALPALVKRLHERCAGHRGVFVACQAANALAGLIPTLPEEMQSWLCILANPLRPPAVNLRSALDSSNLSDEVRESFATVCVRRSLWRARHAGQSDPHEDLQGPNLARDPALLWKGIEGLLGQTGQAAVRHLQEGPHTDEVSSHAREKEAAWLLARLCELLQRSLDAARTA